MWWIKEADFVFVGEPWLFKSDTKVKSPTVEIGTHIRHYNKYLQANSIKLLNCFANKPIKNISWAGTVYQSITDWLFPDMLLIKRTRADVAILLLRTPFPKSSNPVMMSSGTL